jgi:hypothetical protein
MLQGIDNVGFIFGSKEKRQERKAKRQARRTTRKTKRVAKRARRKENRVVKREARGGSRFKKIALAPARTAFLGALKINFLNIAKKLAAGYQRNPEAVKKFAARFGFKWSNFATAINQGAKSQISGNAALGVAAEAVIATMLPIIIALPALFKLLGVGKGPEDVTLEKGIEATGGSLEDPGYYATDPEPGAQAWDPAQDGPGIDMNFLLLAGAAVAAVFVLPKLVK